MPVKPLEWPEPCTGEHVPLAHDHSWWAGITDPKLHGKRQCSERFQCRKCWRWYDGQACKVAKTAA